MVKISVIRKKREITDSSHKYGLVVRNLGPFTDVNEKIRLIHYVKSTLCNISRYCTSGWRSADAVPLEKSVG